MNRSVRQSVGRMVGHNLLRREVSIPRSCESINYEIPCEYLMFPASPQPDGGLKENCVSVRGRKGKAQDRGCHADNYPKLVCEYSQMPVLTLRY